jgi:hypothetical protein
MGKEVDGGKRNRPRTISIDLIGSQPKFAASNDDSFSINFSSSPPLLLMFNLCPIFCPILRCQCYLLVAGYARVIKISLAAALGGNGCCKTRCVFIKIAAQLPAEIAQRGVGRETLGVFIKPSITRMRHFSTA